MKRLRHLLSFWLVLTFLMIASTVTTATANAEDSAVPVIRNPGAPSYRVSLRGDSTGQVWRGKEWITFTNLEAEPLTTIWLRLWSNGVRGCGVQAIVVAEVSGGTAGALSRRCTAFPVDLDVPLAQGGKATISMRLRIELPKKNDRFGYQGVSRCWARRCRRLPSATTWAGTWSRSSTWGRASTRSWATIR